MWLTNWKHQNYAHCFRHPRQILCNIHISMLWLTPDLWDIWLQFNLRWRSRSLGLIWPVRTVVQTWPRKYSLHQRWLPSRHQWRQKWSLTMLQDQQDHSLRGLQGELFVLLMWYVFRCIICIWQFGHLSLFIQMAHLGRKGPFWTMQNPTIKLWTIISMSICVLLGLPFFYLVMKLATWTKFVLPNLITLYNYTMSAFFIFGSQTLNYGIVQFI